MNDKGHTNGDILFADTRAASIHVPRCTVAFVRAMRDRVLIVFNRGDGLSVASTDPKLDACRISDYFGAHSESFLGLRNMEYVPADQMGAWCSDREPVHEEDGDEP